MNFLLLVIKKIPKIDAIKHLKNALVGIEDFKEFEQLFSEKKNSEMISCSSFNKLMKADLDKVIKIIYKGIYRRGINNSFNIEYQFDIRIILDDFNDWHENPWLTKGFGYTLSLAVAISNNDENVEQLFCNSIHKKIIDYFDENKLLILAHDNPQFEILYSQNCYCFDSLELFKRYLGEKIKGDNLKNIQPNLFKEIEPRINAFFISLKPKYNKILTMTSDVKNIHIHKWVDYKLSNRLAKKLEMKFDSIIDEKIKQNDGNNYVSEKKEKDKWAILKEFDKRKS